MECRDLDLFMAGLVPLHRQGENHKDAEVLQVALGQVEEAPECVEVVLCRDSGITDGRASHAVPDAADFLLEARDQARTRKMLMEHCGPTVLTPVELSGDSRYAVSGGWELLPAEFADKWRQRGEIFLVAREGIEKDRLPDLVPSIPLQGIVLDPSTPAREIAG